MLNVAGIVEDSVVDGPGLRIAIFCQGCPHRCPGCHNPDTWECNAGTKVSEERLCEIVKSNPLCKAVTFSGGEPFAQAHQVARVAGRLREAGYEVASYSGYTFEQLLNGTEAQKELLQTIDVLIDGPFIQEEKSLNLNFRGSRNQRVLNMRESLKQKKAVEETSSRWLGEYERPL